ncbi:MAG: 2-oxoglutarate dehydrogenase E1 component [Thermodesulfobacteriota bacterium]
MDISETWNADFVDAQYQLWKSDPQALSQDWRFFFEGFELAASGRFTPDKPEDDQVVLKQARVEALIYRYRDVGHLLACLDPLSACPIRHPLLELSAFGLSEKDLDRTFFARHFSKARHAPLRDILQALRETYCRSIGVEYMHLQDPAERRWLQERMEPVRNQPQFDRNIRVRILNKLYQAALFEAFLHKKYIGQTRFSLEGADIVIPMLDFLVRHAAQNGCREIILGMAHRGRLNVQAHILNRPYEEIFAEFEHCHDPESLFGSGDVKYHTGYLADVRIDQDHPVQIFLVNNPSHLESVNPVVEGFARARQDSTGDGARAQVLPLLIHGDAAFAGQGIVAETLNMSQLDGYLTGGTLHLVINNQIGYTTLPEHARSTRYSTDIAKMLSAPIFHVHGENAEAAVHAAQLACDYRSAFKKDVVVDLVCYRRYGHNEGDEPYFTQPLMYEQIRQRPPLYQIYTRKLMADEVVTEKEVQEIETAVNRTIEADFEAVRSGTCPLPAPRLYDEWKDFHGNYSHKPLATGVARKKLLAYARSLNNVPKGFSLYTRLEKLLERRLEAVVEGRGIDWAGAEALAFASLLAEGFPIRLSGQDSGRGTFSQRHCVLTDTRTGRRLIPLNGISKKQAPFSVYDSLLSEAGVLGFEYGYSLARPRVLTLWEAQFGDFANNAQAIIDLYISSGETKWQRLSGLVLLLPHGYEGLGPEHSSARLERYLQLCAQDNLQVCNVTTPAQYFHLLRRQANQRFRKPLVLMTPKSLLRHPLAVSDLKDLTTGSFNETLEDPDGIRSPGRLIFCSGKIFYELLERRRDKKFKDTAIVRLEQFYPFPLERLQKALRPYQTVKQWRWVQEEPQNMGAWNFIGPRLETLLGQPLEYVGRKASASTATGYPGLYKKEQADILDRAFMK